MRGDQMEQRRVLRGRNGAISRNLIWLLLSDKNGLDFV